MRIKCPIFLPSLVLVFSPSDTDRQPSLGGHATFFSFLNSAVHVIMYAYYGLSALGPHMSKYLWWKKYLTAMQMAQFVAIFVHSFQLLFRDCNFPKAFMAWIGCHGILFWFLFSAFYKKTYSKHSKSATQAALSSAESIKHAIEKRL